MKLAQSFRELHTYAVMREAVHEVFNITKRFPSEERFSMTDQIRRSARAAKAMLAEAWARRRYEAASINKLNEAQAEVMETQSWLDDGLDCGYIDPATHKDQDAAWQRIGGMLERMIQCSDSFCQKRTRDQKP